MPCSEITRIVTTVATVQILVDLVAYWRVYSREPYQRAVDKLNRLKTKWDDQLAKATASSSKSLQETTTTSTTTRTARNSKSGSTAVVVATAGKKNTSSSSSGRHNKQDHSSSSSTGASTNMAKKVQRAEDDYKNALADLSRRHILPNLGTALVFLFLMKILGAELQGHVIAVLPFAPFRWLRKLTARNLEFHDGGVIDGDDDGMMGVQIAQACNFTCIYFLTNASVKYYIHQLFGFKAPHGAESMNSVVDSPMGQSFIRAMGMEETYKELKQQ